jgi:tRNA(Ile)-lysidine synthase TilS/MesJ
MREELAVLAERKPQVEKTMVTLRKLTGDELARDMYERREKALRDQQSREDWARQQEREKWQAEREKWQGILADKDAEMARLREQLEKSL